jgi:hypothetical protein
MVREALHAHAEAVRNRKALVTTDLEAKTKLKAAAAQFAPRGRTTLIVSPSENHLCVCMHLNL